MFAGAGAFVGLKVADDGIAVNFVLSLICPDAADDVYFICHLVDPCVDPVAYVGCACVGESRVLGFRVHVWAGWSWYWAGGVSNVGP